MQVPLPMMSMFVDMIYVHLDTNGIYFCRRVDYMKKNAETVTYILKWIIDAGDSKCMKKWLELIPFETMGLFLDREYMMTNPDAVSMIYSDQKIVGHMFAERYDEIRRMIRYDNSEYLFKAAVAYRDIRALELFRCIPDDIQRPKILMADLIKKSEILIDDDMIKTFMTPDMLSSSLQKRSVYSDESFICAIICNRNGSMIDHYIGNIPKTWRLINIVSEATGSLGKKVGELASAIYIAQRGYGITGAAIELIIEKGLFDMFVIVNRGSNNYMVSKSKVLEKVESAKLRDIISSLDPGYMLHYRDKINVDDICLAVRSRHKRYYHRSLSDVIMVTEE